MTDKIQTHGISERNVAGDALDVCVEELQIDGYTLIDSGIPEAKIDDLRDRLLNANAAQQEEGGDAFASDTFIVRCPLAYDEAFLSVATNQPLMDLCRRLLGENFVLMQQNGVINRSLSADYQSRWHRDISYQHFVSSKKIAINALLCLDDFTLETGGTFVLPATHLQEKFPSDNYVRGHEKVAMAKAGSFLVLDAFLFHRSGTNVSGKNRSGVNHVIGRPFFAQQLDIPRMLKSDLSADPFLRRYLGYQWNPAPDVSTWRSNRA